MLTLGIGKRAYWLLPVLILDPFDLLEALFDVHYDPPQWAVWALFGLGLFVASGITYNEARTQSKRRSSQPLEILRSSPDESGGTRFERLCVHNPNEHAVPDCYGRLVKSEIENARPDAYKGPPEGYHFSWSTHGGNSTHAAIGAHSEDYLDLFFVVGPEAKKCYTPHLNQLTGTIERVHAVLVGRHKLIIEVGSKTYDVQPQQFEVIVGFGGGLDLSVVSIKPLRDSEETERGP